MKRRVKVLIDAEILQLARQRAAEERRPLSELIQEVLANYLRKFVATPKEQKKAYQLFCERPMKIPPKQLRYVVKKNMWDFMNSINPPRIISSCNPSFLLINGLSTVLLRIRRAERLLS